MRVIVDNTGIHCVARCLERQSKEEDDLHGLLQFATQLVFCDKILVNTYESDEVRIRTSHVLDEVAAAGISTEAIECVECTQENWAKGCLQSAEVFAEDFIDLLPQGFSNLAGTSPDFADPKVAPDARVHAIISTDRSQAELAELATVALARGAVGLVEYSITACPTLWKVIRKAYVDQGGWAAQTTAHIAVLLRVCRNSDVATEYEAHYAPAVGRSRFLRCRGTLIQERLANLVAEAASKLARCQIKAPSIEQVLTREAKGDPRAVLTEAVKLREKAKPLRAVLRKVTRNLVDGDDDSALVFENQMMELSHLLEMELGLARKPRLRDALELCFILGIPAPSLSGKGLADWLLHYWKRRRVAVLTDLSKAAAFARRLSAEYQRLLHAVSTANR